MKLRARAALVTALAGISLSFTLGSARAEVSPGVRAEIDHLVSYVGSSGCEFFRNGSWYEGTKGQSHITDKLNYLLGKDMIRATADFIDKAATQSSMSGQAYKVRCNGVETASAKWLNDELARFRATGGAALAKAPVRVTTVASTAPSAATSVAKIN
jgi:hypothetical protein